MYLSFIKMHNFRTLGLSCTDGFWLGWVLRLRNGLKWSFGRAMIDQPQVVIDHCPTVFDHPYLVIDRSSLETPDYTTGKLGF
jgi:hypothetical protein